MCSMFFFFFFKQKTAYEMRISDWSSDVCSSDLVEPVAREGVADLLPQFVGREVARVDQPIRPAPERRQQLALPPDAVARRAIGRKRMAAARFVIASFEFLPRAIEEQRADVVTVPLAQSLDPFDNALRIEIARARTDAERERARAACRVLGRRGGPPSVGEEEWTGVRLERGG